MELNKIIHRYQARFQEKYGKQMTRQHTNTMQAVLDCRTARYGMMALDCSACDFHSTRYHSCGNRACPSCQNHDTTLWLNRQQQKLLPVNYFMVTFTLPSELRSLCWNHQKMVYNVMLAAAKSTLSTFARNDKRLGADIGMTMVLHTHTRQLDYHPHVHVIVPGVCVNKRRNQCSKLKGEYLYRQKNLAKVFRAKFLGALETSRLSLPPNVPDDWIADCRYVGKGLPALQYLSRYLYRGVVSEKNILKDDGKRVTFGFIDGSTGAYETKTVSGEDFLWLVFQHVLPKGFRRVRDVGFLNGNGKSTLKRIQLAFNVLVEKFVQPTRPWFACKVCGGVMNITAFVRPLWRSG